MANQTYCHALRIAVSVLVQENNRLRRKLIAALKRISQLENAK